MTGRHPAQDVLADLAAEVLPDHEARVVEAHVIGCARCADLLADAERMRRLLLTSDPGPMPTEVWSRIADSLSQQVAPAPGAHVADAATTDPWITAEWPAAAGQEMAGAADPAGAYPEAPTAQWEQFAAGAPTEPATPPSQVAPSSQSVQEPRLTQESQESQLTSGFASDSGDVDEEARSEDAAGAPPTRPGRSTRRSASALRSRRQIRSEDRTMSMLRYARPLGIAAAVLVLAGAAGLAVVKLPLGESSPTLTTAAQAGSSASAGEQDRAADVPGSASAGEVGADAGRLTMATNTDYTKADLAERALMLTPDGREASSTAGEAAAGGAEQLNRAPSISGNDSLIDPVKLAECLAVHNIEGVQPIAVDFARYEGQEATIIVAAGRNGGYEVLAVPRTCGPDDERQLAYVSIPPS